jgi:hypothetical protein
MTPHEVNVWIAFLVIGLPILVVFGGTLILHMAVALAALALFFSHPALAIVLSALWFFPWRFVFIGLALGEGLKFSGVFRRLSRRRPRYPRRRAWTRAELDRYDDEGRRTAPRLRGQRPADYAPFDDNIDFGE